MIFAEINNKINCPVNKKNVQKIVEKFSKFFKLNNKSIKELSIAFVSKKEIRKINKNYRGIDKETNVLSFGSLLDKKKRQNYDALAEVIICYEQAQKQAKENNVDVQDEIKKLLIHGLLHLIGYDHKKNTTAIEMERLELEIGKL